MGDHIGPEWSVQELGRVTTVRAMHEARLLRYPNVVAVADGIRARGGQPTGEPCIVVYVSRKVPPEQLRADEVLPEQLDGVDVDVVPVGEIRALQT